MVQFIFLTTDYRLEKKIPTVKADGCSLPDDVYNTAISIILQSVVKPGSHGCVGPAEDAQVLLTFDGSNISAGWRCAGGGRWLISVETSVNQARFTRRRLLLRLMWSRWERRALRSCRRTGTGNVNFGYLRFNINKPLQEPFWPSYVHVGASVESFLLWEASFLSDSGDPRPNRWETQRRWVKGTNLPAELKRVSNPEQINSPLLSIRPASCSFLSCCACIPSASSVWSSSSTPFTYTARETVLMQDLRIKNIKRFKQRRPASPSVSTEAEPGSW